MPRVPPRGRGRQVRHGRSDTLLSPGAALSSRGRGAPTCRQQVPGGGAGGSAACQRLCTPGGRQTPSAIAPTPAPASTPNLSLFRGQRPSLPCHLSRHPRITHRRGAEPWGSARPAVPWEPAGAGSSGAGSSARQRRARGQTDGWTHGRTDRRTDGGGARCRPPGRGTSGARRQVVCTAPPRPAPRGVTARPRPPLLGCGERRGPAALRAACPRGAHTSVQR